MPSTYRIHKRHFDALEQGSQDFDFITIKHNDKDTPVVILSIRDRNRHDELDLVIAPVYQVEQGFPKSISITDGLYDFDVFPITQPGKINEMLIYFLRTRIHTSLNTNREDALYAAFVNALDAHTTKNN